MPPSLVVFVSCVLPGSSGTLSGGCSGSGVGSASDGIVRESVFFVSSGSAIWVLLIRSIVQLHFNHHFAFSLQHLSS